MLVTLAVACRTPQAAVPVIDNRDAVELGDEARLVAVARGPITEASLAAFLSHRFAPQLEDGTFVADYSGTTEDLLDELRLMGFRDLSELAAVIPADFEYAGAGEFVEEDPANIPGLVRDFMMIYDAERYFTRAWQNRWQSILPANVSALRAYVHDFSPFYAANVLTPDEVRDAPVVRPNVRRARPHAPAAAPAPP